METTVLRIRCKENKRVKNQAKSLNMFHISFNTHYETKHQNTHTCMSTEYYKNVCLSAALY
jgi:hypothetical protein